MNSLWVERVGWTLIHFAWQGTAIALVFAIVLAIARRAPANSRYILACSALALMAAAPLGTYLWLGRELTAAHSSSGGARFFEGEIIRGSEIDRLSWLPWLVGVWSFGVAALSIRLIGTLIHMERWKRRYSIPIDSEWQQRVDAMAKRLGIARAVSVRVSERLGVPSAWGVLKAVIVLPASLLAQMPPDQLETILLHELSHIRRHDYLINLLQTVVETALFYHPAVWWVSTIVRREREHCCDDVVVRSIAHPMPYARALLHLEERRCMLPHPTLSATGSNLMNRIARILGTQPAPSRISPAASTLAALGIVAIVLGGTLQAQAQATTAKKKPLKPIVVKGGTVRKPSSKPPIKAGKTAIKTVVVAGKAAPAKTLTPSLVVGSKGAAATTIIPAKTAIASGVSITTKSASVMPSKLAIATVSGSSRPLMATEAVKSVSVPAALEGVASAQGGLGGGGDRAVPAFGGGGIGGGGFGGAQGYGADYFMPSVEINDGLVSMEVKGTSFADAMRLLAKKSKMSVVIAKGSYDDVSLVLSDVPVNIALETLCKAAGGTYRVEGNIYFVSSKSGAN